MSEIQRLAQLLRSGAVTRKRLADGTGVMIQIEGLKILTLNQTGMFLVDRLADGAETIEDLSNALSAELNVSEDIARADTESFLHDLNNVLSCAISSTP